jgi:glycosyltransferase involved in cell wall biosynthesis
VKELSLYFEEIGLLLPLSGQKNDTQDTLLDQPNICLYPLPSEGGRLGTFERKRKISQICKKVSENYDLLLVRGITPRQWIVWKNCRTPQKAFLLVGSLRENRPPFGLRLNEILIWSLSHVRRWEFKKIISIQSALIFANSPHEVREIQDDWAVKALFVSTNTIKNEQIKPLAFREINNPCSLLFVGRVVQDKGIEELIEALALLNSREKIRFILIIVGNVEISYKEKLEFLATKLGIRDQIEWKGFVPFGETLLQLYGAADFFVLPSWHEGFPHSIWEAGATSTPVVVTSVGGIPGLVNDQLVTFINKHSPEDIVFKIENLINHPNIRKAKIERLHAYVKHFTVERGAEEIVKIFKKH